MPRPFEVKTLLRTPLTGSHRNKAAGSRLVAGSRTKYAEPAQPTRVPEVPRPRSNQPALVWLKKWAASTRRSFGTTYHTTPPGIDVESQPWHGVTPGSGVNLAPERASSVRQDGCWASNRIRVVPPSVIEARLSPFRGGTQ